MDQIKIASIIFPRTISVFIPNYIVHIHNGYKLHFKSERKAKKAAVELDRQVNRIFQNLSIGLANLYQMWKNVILSDFGKNKKIAELFINCENDLIGLQSKTISKHHKARRIDSALGYAIEIAENMRKYYPIMDKQLQIISESLDQERINLSLIGSNFQDAEKIEFSEFTSLN